MAFKGSPSSQHQHCTDEAQKAETVLSAVIYIYIYIYKYVYTPVFKSVAFLKNIYYIHDYSFSALASFLSTSEKTYM